MNLHFAYEWLLAWSAASLHHTRVITSHGGVFRTQDRNEPSAVGPCNSMAIGGGPSMENTLGHYDRDPAAMAQCGGIPTDL
jgi:hypothetical protein